MEIMIMNKWSQILRIIINAANTCVSVSLIEQNLKIENTSRFVATEIFFTADKIFLEIASNSEPKPFLMATLSVPFWFRELLDIFQQPFTSICSLKKFELFDVVFYASLPLQHLSKCLNHLEFSRGTTFSNFCIWSNSAETAASGWPLIIHLIYFNLISFNLIIH